MFVVGVLLVVGGGATKFTTLLKIFSQNQKGLKMPELTPEEKMEVAVKAFLALDAYLIPQFLENLADNGFYVNVNIAASFSIPPVGVPVEKE